MELFNIKNDLGEQDNQVTQHPEIVKDLAKKLGNYLRKVDAQRPALKENGKVIPWPDEAL